MMNITLRYPNRVLLVSAALGIFADWLFYGRWLGVSVPLFVALGLGALTLIGVAEERPPARNNLWLGGAALGFALLLAWRDAPLLTALNMVALLLLVLLVAASYRSGPLARLPGWRVALAAMLTLGTLGLRPLPLLATQARRIQIDRRQARWLLPLLRGLLLALPVVGCFGLLLASADEVFASFALQALTLQLPFDPQLVFRHSLLILTVTWLCAGGMLVALHSEDDLGQHGEELPAEGATRPLVPPPPPLRLGSVEALTVLGAVDALFGSFMLVQGAYFFGGLDTLDRTGMTYASYARRGFFELLAVACLSLALLWVLAVLTRRELPWQRLAFNTASGGMIVLVLGLLASAFQRMLLYEQAYGYTRLRLYTHSFMLWLALVLLLFLLALLRNRPQLFTWGTMLSALLYLATLNIVNPDAWIVRENIARYQASGELDASYLASLSIDATPELVAALPSLDAESRAVITDALSDQRDRLIQAEGAYGWPSWHLGRAQAQWALLQ